MSALDGFNGPTKFSATPYRTLRHFRYNAYDHSLSSVVYKHRYHPGENVAECQRGIFDVIPMVPDENGRVPEPEPREHDMSECECGFYAYHDPAFDSYQFHRFAGIVDCYGDVIVGSKGLRATKLRIVALVTPPVEEAPKDTEPMAFFERMFGPMPGRTERHRAAVAAWHGRVINGWSICADDLDAISRNFPGIPIFDSIADALDLFPLSGAPETGDDS